MKPATWPRIRLARRGVEDPLEYDYFARAEASRAARRALHRGLDSSGAPTLKPHHRAGDLLNVNGMELATFTRVVNLVMVDSSTYTVCVEAHALTPGSAADSVERSASSAIQRKRFIVEACARAGTTPDVHIFEQTRR